MSNSDKKGHPQARLSQAICVLDSLHGGLAEREITKRMDGDLELVEIWIQFLSDLGWIVRKGQSRTVADGSSQISES